MIDRLSSAPDKSAASALSKPTVANISSFIASHLPFPQKENDVPFQYHVPFIPGFQLDLSSVDRVVFSITPTTGFYRAITGQAGAEYSHKYSGVHLHDRGDGQIHDLQTKNEIVPRTHSSQASSAPLAFLHRPFNLDRHRLPRNATVLASHTGFDELLTVGWNVALAERLGLCVDTTSGSDDQTSGIKCVKGYKNDAERKIGLVGAWRPGKRPAVPAEQVWDEVGKEIRFSSSKVLGEAVEMGCSGVEPAEAAGQDGEPLVYDFPPPVIGRDLNISSQAADSRPINRDITDTRRRYSTEQEWAKAEQIRPGLTSIPITAMAIMNAFDQDVVVRALKAAAELDLVELELEEEIDTTLDVYEQNSVDKISTPAAYGMPTNLSASPGVLRNLQPAEIQDNLPCQPQQKTMRSKSSRKRPTDAAKSSPTPPTPVIKSGRIAYITGAARPAGLQAAEKTGMLVICVGHKRCEEWGIRYLAGRVREKFQSVDVVEVYEEEEKMERPRRDWRGNGREKRIKT